MPKDRHSDPRKGFVPLILPWILGLAMFVVYFLTLNRWVTALNVTQVAQAVGFTWQPRLYGPLTYLATLPVHWVSAGKIPLALNFISAICASLTLVLLARCVAILPQDRTELQRQREKSDFAFLTGWPAWYPPILAVLLAGLQLTFWEHATSYTGEMVDLLLFAFIIWQVLEYRLDESEWRLALTAIAYGAGITDSWMFTGFLPLYLTSIIWSKKLGFFNVRFLARMALFGLAGMLLFLLLPLRAEFGHYVKLSFWEALRPNLVPNWEVIKTIKEGDVRVLLAQASLGSLLPLLLMSIRWSSGFGDNSRIGAVLANNMAHVIHAAIFGVCCWIMFDPPFAPHQLFLNVQNQFLNGSPGLTLNFLCALGIGYCCAYFLLVFGRKPKPTRRDANPVGVFPPAIMWLCPLIIAGVFAGTLFGLGALIYHNRPVVQEVNNDTLLKFAQFSIETLPPDGSFILCDSDRPTADQPLRGLLIQAALAREGRTQDYPTLDTYSLNFAPYHRIIHGEYPGKFPLIVNNSASDMSGVSQLNLYLLVSNLAKSNNVTYLHPSYGYYFEHFYQEPHGMAYYMRTLSEQTLLPPPLDKSLIDENERFWDRVVDTLGAAVQKAHADPVPADPGTAVGWLLKHLHPVAEPNENALIVGIFCSRCLNDWGVRLQRAGELEKAARRFQDAKRFNPDNVVADINLAFNESLRQGKSVPLDPAHVNADQFGKYRNWNEVLTANGPFDEISYCFVYGFQFAQNRYFRQALNQFTRVRELSPYNLDTRFQLAQIYLLNRLPDRALEALHDPLTSPAEFGLSETNSSQLSLLAAAGYFQKNELAAGCHLMDTEVARHPDDNPLLMTVSQAYMIRGLYTNALRIINGRLAAAPDDPTWLFGKGYASIQVGAYDDSIKAMTRLLQIQTNDVSAQFDRALAYFQSGKLDQARADYLALQSTHTNAFQVAYGLGEIAWRKKDNDEALRNYEIYVANAPTNSPEFATVQQRLTQLRGK